MLKKIIHTIYFLIVLSLITVAALATLSAFPIFNGFRLFVVQSGSMEPAIHTKSLVAVVPRGEYQVGDIITFRSDPNMDLNNPRASITHRIQSINKEGTISYSTKGDANNSADVTPVTQDQVVGKVRLTLPWLGYPVGFAKTQVGFIVLVIIPATLIIYSEIITIVKEIKKLFKKEKQPIENQDNGNNMDVSSFLIPLLLATFTGWLALIPQTKANFSQIDTLSGFSVSVASPAEEQKSEILDPFSTRSIVLGSSNVLNIFDFDENFGSPFQLITAADQESEENQEIEGAKKSDLLVATVENEDPLFNDLVEALDNQLNFGENEEASTDKETDQQVSSTTEILNEETDSEPKIEIVKLADLEVEIQISQVESYEDGTFLLIYSHLSDEQTLTEAIQGQISIAFGTGKSPVLFLGTCSTNKIECIPHLEVKLISVEVELESISGSKLKKLEQIGVE